MGASEDQVHTQCKDVLYEPSSANVKVFTSPVSASSTYAYIYGRKEWRIQQNKASYKLLY